MRMCGNLKICGLLMRIRVWLGKDRYAKAEPIGQTKKTTSEMNGAGEKVERGKRGSRGMGGTHHGLSNSQTEEPCESRRHSWVISGSMAAFESLRDEGGECLATEGAEAPATWSRNPAPGSRGVGGWRGEKTLVGKSQPPGFPIRLEFARGKITGYHVATAGEGAGGGIRLQRTAAWGGARGYGGCGGTTELKGGTARPPGPTGQARPGQAARSGRLGTRWWVG